MKKITHNDEISFYELFKVISRGKKKIFIIVAISIFCAIFININTYVNNKKNKTVASFKSITTIKPLNEYKLNSFEISNALGIYEINSETLHSNFLEIFEKREIFKDVIRKFEIISKENYENDEEYERAVSTASYHKIKIIIQPTPQNDLDAIPNITIVLNGSDKDQLFLMNKYIKEETNRLAYENLNKIFDEKILILRKFDEIEKKNIQTEIQDIEKEYDLTVNKKIQNYKFRLEDVETNIKYLIADNKLKVTQEFEDIDTLFEILREERRVNEKKEIQFLSEHALTARKLGIAKLPISDFKKFIIDKKLEVKLNFDKSYNFKRELEISLGQIEKDIPYYLRGYEEIEEEIQMLKNRKNVEISENNEKLYLKNKKLYKANIKKNIKLVALLKEKRRLEQDQATEIERKDYVKSNLNNIYNLRRELLIIDRNEELYQRADSLFKQTLAEFSNNFESVVYDPYSTQYENNSIRSLNTNLSFPVIYMIAIFLGLIISLFYIVIEKKN